jgi:hypothetical protein
MDSDNARKTTITNAKMIPDTLELFAGDIILRRDRPATPDLECQAMAPARSSMGTRPRLARSWRSRRSSPTRNSPPRPLGCS